MTNNTADASSFDPPQPGDPRYSFAAVVGGVRTLIDGVDAGQLGAKTPCPEFTVKDLVEHVVMVVRRVAALGNGAAWSSVAEEPLDAGWLDAYINAAHDVMQAWSDPAALEADYEVPWGVFGGVPVMWTYVAELATHGWDLATATGQPFAIDDELLLPAFEGVKFGLPADGRGTDEMPFGEVVDPGSDAPILDQLAGWMGRPVV